MPNAPHRSNLVYVVLFAGTAAVSASPILIRFAQFEALPTLLIAAGRLVLSALMLTPLALRSHRSELAALSRRDLLLAGASGLLLAFHFITWIASLGFTSILVSTVLVTTSPLWVALFEVIFLRARLQQWVIIGLVIALAGGLLIGLAGGDGVKAGSAPLLGGGLALAGAVAFAIYLVIGRQLRGKLSLTPYIWLVYGFGAVLLLLVILVQRAPLTGYSPNAYLLIVLIAIIPQMIGHSAFNYALRYVSATYVGIASQVEPIGSAFAAYLIFAETPLPLQIVGSITLLAGVVVATLGQETPVEAALEAESP